MSDERKRHVERVPTNDRLRQVAEWCQREFPDDGAEGDAVHILARAVIASTEGRDDAAMFDSGARFERVMSALRNQRAMPQTEAELRAACEVEAKRVWGEGADVMAHAGSARVFLPRPRDDMEGVMLLLHATDKIPTLRALLAALREL